MILTLESTDEIVTLNGVQCRRWLGTTAKGITCHVYVQFIAVPDGQEAEFAAELTEKAEPEGFSPPRSEKRDCEACGEGRRAGYDQSNGRNVCLGCGRALEYLGQPILWDKQEARQ
jgi:hypothetical protein